MCRSAPSPRTSDRRSVPRADLRLGDADRDEALARLGEHYAAGRIDKDELDERSDAVWSARTHADLAPVFADLGPALPARGRSHGAGWERRGRGPAPFLPLLLVALVAVTVITHLPFVLLALAAWALVVPRWRRRAWRAGLR